MRHQPSQVVGAPERVRVHDRAQRPDRVLQGPQRADSQRRQQGQRLRGHRRVGLAELGARQAGPQQALGLCQQRLGQEGWCFPSVLLLVGPQWWWFSC